MSGLPITFEFLKQRCTVAVTTGCWEWTGRLTDKGYGIFTRRRSGRKKQLRAHRMMWFVLNGPTHLNVLHHCDNRKCLNPDHLFIGTQADNLRDMRMKGRYRNGSAFGETNGTAKLKVADVTIIRASDETGVVLARRFKVSESAISKVKLHRMWKHI